MRAQFDQSGMTLLESLIALLIFRLGFLRSLAPIRFQPPHRAMPSIESKPH